MSEITELFPSITDCGFREISKATERYNCVAWAASDYEKWWDPTPYPGYYWPEGVPISDSINTLKNVFRLLGYRTCRNSELEADTEKIAIYGKGRVYEHVARQLETGKWTSKLGTLEDIEHDSLAGLIGTEYGTVMCIMKRQADHEEKEGQKS